MLEDAASQAVNDVQFEHDEKERLCTKNIDLGLFVIFLWDIYMP